MAGFTSLILLGYASFAGAQTVNTVAFSPVDVEVTDVKSKDFTLETCGSTWMILSRNNITYPKYDIYIFSQTGDVSISASMTKIEEGGDATYTVSSVIRNISICGTSGAFWVSWGGGLFRFGKGTVGSNRIMEMDMSDHVGSFIVESDGEATWHFTDNAVTTTSGTDTQPPCDASTTEPETDTGSKSSAPGCCYLGRVLTILVLLWAATLIN